MRLRTQSLGGLAAVGTIASFLIKDNIASPERFVYLALLMMGLLVAWIALAVLDLTYYDRMLIGSVHAIHELEKASKQSDSVTGIDLSLRITEAVDKKLPGVTRSRWWNGRKFYYLSIGLMLGVLALTFGSIAWCKFI